MRTRNFILQMLLLAVFSALAHAQVVVTDDANTSSFTPKTNYGSSIALIVCSGSNTYIKFSFANLPAGMNGGNISGANAVLYVDAVLTSGTMDVYAVNGPWSEGTITYNNAPVQGNKILSAVSVSKTGYLSLNLTSTVQAWLNGTLANNGIALVPSSGSSISVSFDSKENILTSHTAQLPLVLVSAGPQGPQGSAGAAGPQGSTGSAGPAGATGPPGPAGQQGPQGLQGLQGLMGLTGLTGATGAAGPAGPAGANGTGFTFRNAFDNSASYAANDVVTYNGSSYVATAASSGPNNLTPDTNSAAWSVMAAQGAAGTAGAAGAQGPAGQAGSQGATGPAGPTGPAGAAGPQGPQGQQGAQGASGASGAPGAPGQSVMSFTEPAGANCTNGGVKLVAVNATTYVCNGSASAGTTFFTISGTMSGLPFGATVALLDNGSDDLTLSTSGSFTFPTPLSTGTSYTVTVLTQPSGGTCAVTNGSGTVANANVSNIMVTCTVPSVLSTLASNQNQPRAITVDGTNVYWTTTQTGQTTLGAIMTVPLAGGTPTAIATASSADPWNPLSIAVDFANVYFTNLDADLPGSGFVRKVPKGGGTIVQLVLAFPPATLSPVPPNVDPPVFGVGFDAVNVYYATEDGIEAIPIVGGSASAKNNFAAPYGMAQDGTGICVTTYAGPLPQNDGFVFCQPSSGPPVTIADNLIFPVGVAIDANHVYWTDNGDGTVKMAPRTGGTITTIASGQSFPFGIAVDSTNVYWTNNGGTVMTAPISGGAAIALASGQSYPMGIAVDNTSVYWTNNGDGTVMKVSK